LVLPIGVEVCENVESETNRNEVSDGYQSFAFHYETEARRVPILFVGFVGDQGRKNQKDELTKRKRHTTDGDPSDQRHSRIGR
jgi:hypothetical protein